MIMFLFSFKSEAYLARDKLFRFSRIESNGKRTAFVYIGHRGKIITRWRGDLDALTHNNGKAAVFIHIHGGICILKARKLLGKRYGKSANIDPLTALALNIGGNIRIIGTKTDGTSWLTGIKNPQDTSTYAIYLNLANTSCVTSGVYERFFTVGGVRYHHIIDKDTLMPSEYFTSLTVICEDGGLADALSTALFWMSYEDGAKLVDSLDGVEVLWIFPDGEMKMSEGLESLVAEK